MSYQILYYHWEPYFDKPMLGGGIYTYCRNLIDYLAQSNNYHINFIYSGFDYTYLPKHPYIKKVCNHHHPNVPAFSLVNSPITAPAHLACPDPIGSVQNSDLENCFRQFLVEQGPFQIIHFHNLEGLTANCLKIAKESGAKVVFSLHNYWAVCPKVNLWKFDSSPCTNYFEGRACVSCIETVDLNLELNSRKLKHLGNLVGLNQQALPLKLIKKIYTNLHRRKLWRKYINSPLAQQLEVTGKELRQDADMYRYRRQEIVYLINRYVDIALSVSERTTSIYRQYGVDLARLNTQYIGSKAAQFQVPPNNPAAYSPGQPFKLIYMNGANRFKGFYFLLEELRSLSEEELSRLELVITSKITDGNELRMAVEHKGQLLSLAQSLHRLRYYPGYKYESIPSMLDGIHLGVVPPLWEDNLPQVTFELLACGVPVLCSNRGGAQEFVRHPAFIFDPAKEGDFLYKLRNIQENPHLLTEFWQEAQLAKPMEQHFKELSEIYQTGWVNSNSFVCKDESSIAKTV